MTAALVRWPATVRLSVTPLTDLEGMPPGALVVGFERRGTLLARRAFDPIHEATFAELQVYLERPVALALLATWVGQRIEAQLFAVSVAQLRGACHVFLGQVVRYPQDLRWPELAPNEHLLLNAKDMLANLVTGRADTAGHRLLVVEGFE